MKGCLGLAGTLVVGILAAVVSPIILGHYQKWQAQDAQIVTVLDTGGIMMSKGIREVAAETKSADSIHSLLIENTGSDDLEEVSLEIISPNGGRVISAGDVLALDAAELPTVSIMNGVLTLKYRMMRKGDITGLWVQTPSAERPVVRAMKKGVSVKQVATALAPRDDDFPIFDLLLAGVGLLVIGLFIGIGIAEAMNAHVLRKVGFDPKEITNMYVETVQKAKREQSR